MRVSFMPFRTASSKAPNGLPASVDARRFSNSSSVIVTIIFHLISQDNGESVDASEIMPPQRGRADADEFVGFFLTRDRHGVYSLYTMRYVSYCQPFLSTTSPRAA